MTIEHTARLEFPNGLGYTPCTPEYLAARQAMDAIKAPDTSFNDLSPADYQTWNELQHAADNMQLNGHLGKSVRY